MKLSQLKIDPEFQSKIPPLQFEEEQQLEQNIIAEGRLLNPIITWNGYILDGQNTVEARRTCNGGMELPIRCKVFYDYTGKVGVYIALPRLVDDIVSGNRTSSCKSGGRKPGCTLLCGDHVECRCGICL